eukprot:3071342-Rhodomonas_salina.2
MQYPLVSTSICSTLTWTNRKTEVTWPRTRKLGMGSCSETQTQTQTERQTNRDTQRHTETRKVTDTYRHTCAISDTCPITRKPDMDLATSVPTIWEAHTRGQYRTSHSKRSAIREVSTRHRVARPGGRKRTCSAPRSVTSMPESATITPTW